MQLFTVLWTVVVIILTIDYLNEIPGQGTYFSSIIGAGPLLLIQLLTLVVGTVLIYDMFFP